MDEGLDIRPSPRRPANDEADRALLRRIGHGDRLALRSLYTSYYQPLLRFMGEPAARVPEPGSLALVAAALLCLLCLRQTFEE